MGKHYEFVELPVDFQNMILSLLLVVVHDMEYGEQSDGWAFIPTRIWLDDDEYIDSIDFTYQDEEYYIISESYGIEMVKDLIEEIPHWTASWMANQTGVSSEVWIALSEADIDGRVMKELIDKTCGIDNYVQAAIRDDGLHHLIGRTDGPYGTVYPNIGNGGATLEFHYYKDC